MDMKGVMPAGRYRSRTKDLTYLARISGLFPRGPGLSATRVNEAFAGIE